MNITEAAAQELLTVVKDSKQFILEQAPDVVQEIIRWGIGKNCFQLILGTLFLLISWKLYLAKLKGKEWVDDEIMPVVLAVGILGVGGALLAPSSIFNLIKIYAAPKLYILEYLGNLVTLKP